MSVSSDNSTEYQFAFRRTFHTVGQGAFYSEEIADGDKRIFRMVYDCGSTSLSKTTLKKKIKSDLGDNDVDLLFISHFDTDHINGIQFLNPKVVIIPFISRDQILILDIYNKVIENSFDVSFAEHPEQTFPNSRIIRIMPEDNESDEAHDRDRIGFDVRDKKLSIPVDVDRINSNVPVNINSNNSIWEFIPFNPNWNKYSTEFKTKLKGENIDWDKLTMTPNGAYIKKYLSVLRDIFKTMKPINNHSLVVYSNATQNVTFDLSYIFDITCKQYCNCFCGLHNIYRSIFPTGCIYFGDATIDDWIVRFYHYLGGKMHSVGMLQVPHHGSYLSKGAKIIDNASLPLPILCVISVGEHNSFGHPSAKVISSLQRKKGIVVLVTDTSSSLLYLGYDCRTKKLRDNGLSTN